MFDACQDETIQRWTLIPRPYSLEDAEWFVENEPEYVTMVIEDSESSMPLGLVSIHDIDEVTREASIGYWIAPWGRGMKAASAAVKLLIATITPDENIQSAVAYIAEENTASRRTIERAGFVEVEREWGMAREFMNEVMAIKYRKTL
ncbi:MAG: GNAT family N-acetyltransferase [Actinomycetota bacterium]|nr:GNAT family N-acetyltransferase [Actinomycetota bacterium]MDA3019608.1 GNAT family N-acetyltransferase [Actinomycetota bacterium]